MGGLLDGAANLKVRVNIVFLFMAGNSYLYMLILCGLAKNTILEVFADTINAFIEVSPLHAFSDSEIACIKLAAKLKISRTAHSPIDGCIGALEIIAVKIIKPRPFD